MDLTSDVNKTWQDEFEQFISHWKGETHSIMNRSLNNEECDNMKCVVVGTDDVGDGGIEENTETETTDDKEWFEQPFIWIIFGVFMVMMVMIKQ